MKKIKIIKASFRDFWYSDKVGQEFTVVDTGIRDYYVSHGGSLMGILVIDAEIIN